MTILPKTTCILGLIAAVIAATTVHTQAQELVSPNDKPVLLAPGIISTPAGEFAPTFTPDGKTVYFTGDSVKIYESKLVNGQWTKPTRISFTGPWKDMDPFLTPDGQKLVFSSYRPYDSSGKTATGAAANITTGPAASSATGNVANNNAGNVANNATGNVFGNPPKKIAHVWISDRQPDGTWSAPRHLDAPVNLPGVNDYAPAISASKDLFVYSPNRDTTNKTSYYFKWLGDHYDAPKPINEQGGIHDPYIAPDESFLVFASGGNLYIRYRKADGWAERISFGPQVNDGRKKSSPCVSPDRKTLYYASDGADGILMIPVKIGTAAAANKG